MADQLTELEALLAKAKLSQLSVYENYEQGIELCEGLATLRAWENCNAYDTKDEKEAKAELICAAVNALPCLIKELREARAMADQLAEADKQSEALASALEWYADWLGFTSTKARAALAAYRKEKQP